MLADHLDRLHVVLVSHAVDAPQDVVGAHLVELRRPLDEIVRIPDGDVWSHADQIIDVLHVVLDLANLAQVGVVLGSLGQGLVDADDDLDEAEGNRRRSGTGLIPVGRAVHPGREEPEAVRDLWADRIGALYRQLVGVDAAPGRSPSRECCFRS